MNKLPVLTPGILADRGPCLMSLEAPPEPVKTRFPALGFIAAQLGIFFRTASLGHSSPVTGSISSRDEAGLRFALLPATSEERASLV
jgi:hypothetical protein